MGRFFKAIYNALLKQVGGLEEIESALERTGGKYLDPEAYAQIEGISSAKARQVLDDAVKGGLLKRQYIYTGANAPVALVLDESDLDTDVRLADLGIIEVAEDLTIRLSRFDSREIYVAPEGD